MIIRTIIIRSPISVITLMVRILMIISIIVYTRGILRVLPERRLIYITPCAPTLFILTSLVMYSFELITKRGGLGTGIIKLIIVDNPLILMVIERSLRGFLGGGTKP